MMTEVHPLGVSPLVCHLDKARGYCLEMIRADFLAGASLEDGDPEVLLKSVSRLFRLLPQPQKQTLVGELGQLTV